MRLEADLKEWKELYDIAIKLKALKPWESLYSMDIITIIESDKKEPCICSIMGKLGDCYGIGAYDGNRAMKGFFEMNFSEGIPPHQLIRYQNNIMCYFGDREELTTKELKIIKDLGLKFRGRNNWIYFRTFESGYVPYMPSKEEVINLTKIFYNLYDALHNLYNGIEIDFEDNKTLLHKFDEKNNKWVTTEEEIILPDMSYIVPVLEDELLINKLKKQKRNKGILEVDIAYINEFVKNKNYEKPIGIKMCLLTEVNEGIILDQAMIEPEDDEIDMVLGITINYIQQRGIPEKILVRDGYIYSLLMDLCYKLNIELIETGSLEVIDDFVESFYRFRF